MSKRVPLKLASTGRRIADLPEGYAKSIAAAGVQLSSGSGCWFVDAAPTESEMRALERAIHESNLAQEREWGVGGPPGFAAEQYLKPD